MDKFRIYLGDVLKISFFCLTIILTLGLFVEALELDQTPPRITNMEPIADSVIKEARPWIRVLLLDDESGLDEKSVVMSVDGLDVSHLLSLEDIQGEGVLIVSYRPEVELLPGKHWIALEVKDLAGNIKREEWSFTIESKKASLNYGLSLVNSLSYSFIPIARLQNTSNLSFNVQLPQNHRLSFQAQSTITDWPSGAREPNLGSLYASINRYALSWQTNYFDLQYGHISLPFNSSLLQFGMGFKGAHLSGKTSTAIRNLNIFKGLSVSSAGLGLSVSDNLGGFYSWQTRKSRNQIYAIHMKSRYSKANVIGLQDERTFKNGFLFSELLYGLGDTNGGSLRLQGARELWGIHWNGDLILDQESNPVSSLTSAPSGKGDTYRIALNADKFLGLNSRLNFGYWQSGDNLSGREDRTFKGQGWQLGLQGTLLSSFNWQASYNGGQQRTLTTNEQHSVRLSIRQNLAKANWNNSISASSFSGGRGFRSQWSFSYNRPLTNWALNTSSTMQITFEEKKETGTKNDIRLRLSGDRAWLTDKLKTRLTIEYQNSKENISPGQGPRRQALRLNSDLSMEITKSHSVSLGGRISFWENSLDTVTNGVDLGFNFMWRARIF